MSRMNCSSDPSGNNKGHMMLGLTSVTFRNLSYEEIIVLATRNHLDCIEWGGDVHVPAGHLSIAREVGRQTRRQGLSIASYGSYYSLLEHAQPREAMRPVLDSAAELGASTVRIWAGRLWTQNTNCRRFTTEHLLTAIDELDSLCEIAAPYGITLSLEKHRQTLTENPSWTYALLHRTQHCNISAHWQPNPCQSISENVEAIRILSPFIRHVHVFHWTPDNDRLPLTEGKQYWIHYINALRQCAFESIYLLEFVRNNAHEAFIEDCKALRLWIQS